MYKTASIIIILALVIGMAIIFLGGSKSDTANTESAQRVEIKDGIQYITLTARGGYSPRITEAKGGIPTKLIMKTKGTYDCSAALVIHAVGYQNVLPQTGQTEIDLGVPKSGEPITGVCGMGMYSFKINFS
jgi:plastocyanin domain-containing protein